MIRAILFAAFLSSCSSAVTVDVSDGTLQVGDYRTPVETSRIGTGKALGSRRTPLGTYTLTREPSHRFGPVLRLSGYQGERRGILIHRDFRRGDGTNGCICPPDLASMKKVFARVPDGTPITIRL